MTKASLCNILTIDVEEWFHTSRLEQFIPFEKWESLDSKVIPQIRRCLEILENNNTKATFFVLGWVAERQAALIKEIDALGHEIACHGYRHQLIYNISRKTFREYTVRAKSILEDLIGKPVTGYRATSFSIVKSTLWALDIIKEAGFVYDSSMYPIRHDIYGVSGFPRFPFRFRNGLVEIPLSTWRILGRNFPFGGGGYFRLYPFWMTCQGIKQLNRVGQPVVIYLHPWEMDPDCPRHKEADLRSFFCQYVNLNKTAGRLSALLSRFNFEPLGQYVKRHFSR